MSLNIHRHTFALPLRDIRMTTTKPAITLSDGLTADFMKIVTTLIILNQIAKILPFLTCYYPFKIEDNFSPCFWKEENCTCHK